jgi:hypothetical protein
MTRVFKKVLERSYVEEVARLLGAEWRVSDDREHPDFVVAEGSREFGLEVTQIFTGPSSRAGSLMKKAEADRQAQIETARRDYEAIHRVPLSVRIDGYICEENLAGLVEALVATDFPSQPVGRAIVPEGVKGLRVRAMKANFPDWKSWEDSRGWVDRNPEPKIADRIEEKAQELPRYKSAVGPDVRLLIVADRFKNSGKLRLEDGTAFDLQGFQMVYFYSRPESVTVLR